MTMVTATKVSFLLLAVYVTVGQNAQGKAQGLDGLRRNIPGEPGKDYPIFSTDILRKLNPGIFGGGRRQGGQQRRSGAGQQTGAGQSHTGGQRFQGGQQPQTEDEGREGGQQQGNARNSKATNIPGVPGKDYPTHSLGSLQSRFPSIQMAPEHLVVKDYHTRFSAAVPELPRSSGGSNGRRGRPSGRGNSNNELFSPEYCPGGTIQLCIDFCPANVYAKCVEQCGQAC